MRTLVSYALAAVALATGVARLWPHLAACEGAGCMAGALLGVALATAAAFVALILVDYLLHHARLVAIPAVVGLVAIAVLHPSFAIGLGAALVLLTTDGSPSRG